jgi:putative sigma-54 modulation protein
MTINVQSVHFDADKKLLAFIDEKVNKLSQFNENIVGCDVILRLDKSSTADNKIAEIKFRVKGHEMFAKKQCSTFEEAIDLTVAAAKSQILKHKDKATERTPEV